MSKSASKNNSQSKGPSKASKKPRGLRRLLLLVVLFILLLPIAAFFALPPIASAMVPGLIERAAGTKIDGDLTVSHASFSWSGTQRIAGVELTDPSGETVANLDLSMQAGLLDLLLGSRDLGTITISGNADITRDADGTTNLQRALGTLLDPKPDQPEPDKPAGLPGNFSARLAVDGFNASYTDLETGRIARLSNIDLNALLAPGTPIDLTATAEIRASDPADPDATGEPAPLAAAIALTDWSDADGTLTPGTAIATIGLSLEGVRTAIVDDALNQRGLLVDVLGDSAGATIVTSLSPNLATLDFEFTSPRATVRLDGTIEDRVLRLTEPAVIEVRTISPDLASRAFDAMPWIGSIEKTASDGPATITLSALTLPLNGSLEGFDAQMSIDLGGASFETSPQFAQILALAEWDVSGQIGRRLAPLDLIIDAGTLSFDEFAVPLGEFTLVTSGRVDLVNRTREVVVTVPFDALSAEFADRLKLDLRGQLARLGPIGDILKDATNVPLRVTGSLDEPPRIEVDTDLMRSNLLDGITEPGGAGEQLLRGIFDRIGGG